MTALTLSKLYRRFQAGERNFSGCRLLDGDESPCNKITLDTIDLSGADLSGIYFQNVSMRNVLLRGAHLSNTVINSVDLTGSDLKLADLTDATFINSDLPSVVLGQSILNRCSFQLCRLDGADLRGLVATEVKFLSCSMKQANLSDLKLNESSFFQADLTEAIIGKSEFYKCYFAEANFRRARMMGTRLYSGAFGSANFTDSDLSEADLTRSEVTHTVFTRTQLDGANLESVRGDTPVWRDASLRNTKFTSSSLREANFISSDCSGASFEKAQIIGSTFLNMTATGTNFTRVRWDRGVIVGSTFVDAILDQAYLWLTEVDDSSRSTMAVSDSAWEYTSGGTVETEPTTMFSVVHNVPSHAVVNIFYGTDRKRLNDLTNGEVYGTEWTEQFEVGICQVSIPRERKLGSLESPSIWRLEISWDPDKHISVLSCKPEAEDKFFRLINDRILSSSRRQALLFLHGFNVTFDDAVRRTAQLAYDLSFDGPALTYTWPTTEHVKGYVVDGNHADRTVPHLTSFLKNVLNDQDLTELHVIAHSMGNRALIGALTRLVKDVPSLTAKINHVVFTAPDVDAQVFTDAMPYVLPAGRAFTLYASSRDRALNVAKSINGYRRAGEAGETILVIPPVSTIDASLLDTDLVGHSYYGDNRSVISDIFYLLKEVPASSRLLKERSKGDLVYWEFSA